MIRLTILALSLCCSIQLYSQSLPTEKEVSKPLFIKIGNETQHFGLSKPVHVNVGDGEISPGIHITIGDVGNEKIVLKEVAVKETINNELESEGVPKFYSLIIGVNDYKHNDGNLADLKNPIRDARNLQSILTTQYLFQQENSILLINPQRQEILNELEKLLRITTPRDNLLIFYAGHGVWDSKLNVGYWLPSDAVSEQKSSWISNSTIKDYIAGISSKHTLLITDACFGGSIFRSRDVKLTELGMSNLYRYTSRGAMTSGMLTTVPDESKFMMYLLKRLTEFDDKFINARQLFNTLEIAVINNSRSIPQFGVIQDTGDEGGDFIFIKKM